MNNFTLSLWSETLKARRSKAPFLSLVIFLIFPFVGGLFMIIIRDPVAAQSMGLISVKAQLVAGEANWPAFFDVIFQAMGLGGYILYSFITAWVFGREFSDRTAKELMALPVPRTSIVNAKFVLTGLWVIGLTLIVYLVGLAVGMAVNIPGWSVELAWTSLRTLMSISILNLMLMPFVALLSSIGRGYLPALGWAILTLIGSQIISILGWGDILPWSVPVLLSGMFGPQGTAQLGNHSYLLVLMAVILGIGGTLFWWLKADQTK